MDFRRLQHFIHAAEAGSISTAANRLHIVQPALSQSIQRLEDELNATLFERSRRGIKLTQSGEIFLHHAYGILNQYNRAKEAISTIGGAPKGAVSVAMTASALEILTVPLNKNIGSRFPDIELNLEEGLAGSILQGLDAGWFDLVVNYLLPPSESLIAQPIIEEEMFLVTAANDEGDSNGQPIEFSDLKGLPLMLPKAHHGVLGVLEPIAREKGFSITRSPHRGALHPTIKLIESGFGPSILPMSALHGRMKSSHLSIRRIVNPKVTSTLYLAYPSREQLTPATVAVMDVLRETVSQVHENGDWPGTLLLE
ncbi:MAG: LysR family transcriptional regulator [Henriciella sp.]